MKIPKPPKRRYLLGLSAFIIVLILSIGIFIVTPSKDMSRVLYSSNYNHTSEREIEDIHPKLLEGLDEITFVKSEKGGASYFPHAKKIEMRTTLESSLYHELGHHFWYTRLNKTEIEEYCLMFNNTIRWLTNYSKTSCSEDFAENFACLTSDYFFIEVSTDYHVEVDDCWKFMEKKKRDFIEERLMREGVINETKLEQQV